MNTIGHISYNDPTIESYSPFYLDIPQDSLLDPVHFNAILYGDCKRREDVRTYRECSSLVHRTKYQTNTSNSDCPSLKTECEEQNILGKSREELQEEYNYLESELHTINSNINQRARNLITLEQAAKCRWYQVSMQ